MVEFTKFVTFFGADDDPELFDVLADGISRTMRGMSVDGILTCLVNFAHSTNPNAQELFEVANQEFGQRLRHEYSSADFRFVVTPEDMIKIMNVLLEHG